MKKYPICFVEDYIEYEKWAKEDDDGEFWESKIKENADELLMCKKWTGKEITLNELEDLINEFGSVTFDGKSICIINGYID